MSTIFHKRVIVYFYCSSGSMHVCGVVYDFGNNCTLACMGIFYMRLMKLLIDHC